MRESASETEILGVGADASPVLGTKGTVDDGSGRLAVESASNSVGSGVFSNVRSTPGARPVDKIETSTTSGLEEVDFKTMPVFDPAEALMLLRSMAEVALAVIFPDPSETKAADPVGDSRLSVRVASADAATLFVVFPTLQRPRTMSLLTRAQRSSL